MVNSIEKVKVLSVGRGILFYQITNTEKKTWLIPSRNMGTALRIYQPSHWRGTLLKSILSTPLISIMAVKICNFRPIRCKLRKDLKILLSRILGINEFDYSIFCGTPSVHQKMTIQLSNNNQILGYCKISSQSIVADLFLREQDTLNFLHSVGIEDVPICLYNGNLLDCTYVFVQTTKKSRHSKLVHQWGEVHDIFLNNLYEKTRKTILFENTEYYRHLKYLYEHLDCLSEDITKEYVQIAIEYQMKYKGSLVEYAICHADFTPWNMFVEGDRLFVFDWEYAVRTCPKGLDYYHFFLQTMIFEKHYNIKQIWSKYINNSKRNDEKFLSYLLLILSLYLERNATLGSIESEPCLNIWTGLIKILVEIV